ncbi:hypothetical protein Snoj_70840 [Streptomyces nojiriensis]|uniref:Uncharacterized protein n=1 Tax=Streptomyces nojiriensis TaxID=66374 RepID=A0ABQ3SYE9_9ACTN|nr:hypothetical protein [Streptomyces nojiriensis]QTI46683.1 hypothetical protein JYK04_04521 [Streptomyces nojiriensis]GGS00619.1 hypothetical protein GCM10010205_31720 [Streptomyces nojiriensis]GHI73166.1 hypothetical protein Snoj_70840 [Streptomyces nojiriensis]
MNIGSRALFAGAPAEAVRVLHRVEHQAGDWAPLREVHPQVIELDTSGL